MCKLLRSYLTTYIQQYQNTNEATREKRQRWKQTKGWIIICYHVVLWCSSILIELSHRAIMCATNRTQYFLLCNLPRVLPPQGCFCPTRLPDQAELNQKHKSNIWNEKSIAQGIKDSFWCIRFTWPYLFHPQQKILPSSVKIFKWEIVVLLLVWIQLPLDYTLQHLVTDSSDLVIGFYLLHCSVHCNSDATYTFHLKLMNYWNVKTISTIKLMTDISTSNYFYLLGQHYDEPQRMLFWLFYSQELKHLQDGEQPVTFWISKSNNLYKCLAFAIYQNSSNM